jgi:hypothetical protein
MLKLSQKPGFWDLGPRAGVRNRVSYQNLGKMPKLSQKPGFWDLGRSRGSQKPGFFSKSGVKMPKLSQKPGFLDLLTTPIYLGSISW